MVNSHSSFSSAHRFMRLPRRPLAIRVAIPVPSSVVAIHCLQSVHSLCLPTPFTSFQSCAECSAPGTTLHPNIDLGERSYCCWQRYLVFFRRTGTVHPRIKRVIQ